MTAFSTRRIVDPDYATARPSISLPSPLDVDLAPQLLAVTLTQAALAATHRALDSAHPILAVTSRLTEQPNLAASEHFAILVLHAGSQLALLLSEYAHAVTKENIDPDDNDAPF
jgi:hypothetical protein